MCMQGRRALGGWMKLLGIGVAADDTFRYLLRRMRERGSHVDALDLVHLTLRGNVSFSLQDPLSSYLEFGGASYHLAEYTGIVARVIDVSSSAPSPLLATKYRATASAITEMLQGAHLANFKVVSPIGENQTNFSKILHIANLASNVELKVPRTLVTNDPNEVEAFLEKCDGKVVVKGVSSHKTWARRYIPQADSPRLTLLRNCPILLQEMIEGPDVRVHVANGVGFAEQIVSADIDYRRTRGNVYRSIDLPKRVQRSCLELARAMDLPLIGIDFKVCARSDRWWFLEANSQPCYQGYDRRANEKISDALYAYLMSCSAEPAAASA